MFWCILIPLGLIAGALSEELCNVSVVNNLPDTAFTSSSYHGDAEDEKKYGPSKARALSPEGTKLAGTWVSATVNQKQWLQVDLLKPSIVKEISTWGRNVDENTDCCQQWVSSYLVKFSADGSTWFSANCSTPLQSMIFHGNDDTHTEVRNKLSCPVIARYIRVLPQSWHVGIAMRIDMFGCHIENEVERNTVRVDPIPSPTDSPSRPVSNRIPDMNDEYAKTVKSSNLNIKATPPAYTENWFPWTNANKYNSDLVRPKPIWYTTLFAEVPPTESTSNHKRYARSTSQNPWDARDSGPQPGKGGRMIRIENSPYPIIVYPISETDTYVPQGKRIHGPTDYVPRAFIPKEYINGDYPTPTDDRFPSGTRNTDQIPNSNQWNPSNNPQVPVTNNRQISEGTNWQLSGSNNPTPSRSSWELSGGLNNPNPTGNGNWYPAGTSSSQNVGTNWQLSGGVNNLPPTSSSHWNPSGSSSDLPQSGGTNWPLSEGSYPDNSNLNSGSNRNQPQGPSNNQNIGNSNWNTPPSSNIHSTDKVTWRLSGVQSNNWDPSSVQKGYYRNAWSPQATPNSGNNNWGPTGPSNPRVNGGQSWTLSNVPTSQQFNNGNGWNGRFQEGVIAPKANDRCIESCYNRPDGDYQSCRSCRVYISCSNGNTFANRECPGTLVWNDHQKLCDWTSTSCS